MSVTDPWFDPVYLKYYKSLLRTARLLLHNEARAEEIVHDVFLLFLLARDKPREHDNPAAWLFSSLQKCIKNEKRRASSRLEVPLDADLCDLPAPEPAEQLADVLPCGLSDADRQLLIWHLEDNLSHEEIARRLHCSPHACEMRVNRAKKRCARLLLKK